MPVNNLRCPTPLGAAYLWAVEEKHTPLECCAVLRQAQQPQQPTPPWPVPFLCMLCTDPSLACFVATMSQMQKPPQPTPSPPSMLPTAPALVRAFALLSSPDPTPFSSVSRPAAFARVRFVVASPLLLQPPRRPFLCLLSTAPALVMRCAWIPLLPIKERD